MDSTSFRRGPAGWVESIVICAAAWLLMVSIPVSLGGIGISWDGLNHHVYLGWTAQYPRFDRDVVAASSQAFLSPYVNWPLYKLASSGWSGSAAGAVLVSVQWIAVPAVWIIARSCIPGRGWYESMFRALSVLLAFSSGLLLSLFDTTANDLIASIPLIWALGISLYAALSEKSLPLGPATGTILAGLLAGVSVALKLSNGPLAAALPVLWWLLFPVPRRLSLIAFGVAAMVVSFALTYGYWGWQLWNYAGNPIYPFADVYFNHFRRLLHWQP